MIVLLAGVLTGLPAPALADLLKVEVAANPPVVSTVLGGRFMITTEVKNAGNAPTGEILAHLNVASIEGSVYVDPEDWSSDRSQQLSLKPGESRKLSWEIQAVNSGLFAAYVVVVPFGNTVNGNENLTTTPLIRVDVAPRTTLTAGGALPVVLAVPLLIGLDDSGPTGAYARSTICCRPRWWRSNTCGIGDHRDIQLLHPADLRLGRARGPDPTRPLDRGSDCR